MCTDLSSQASITQTPRLWRLSGADWHTTSKELANLGEKDLTTANGMHTQATWQIVDVNRPLSAVRRMCKQSNRVIFGRAGGVVQNLTSGKLIPFERRNGIYLLSLWLEDDSSQPFHRP